VLAFNFLHEEREKCVLLFCFFHPIPYAEPLREGGVQKSMALTVKSLNGDTTFLLSFAPPFAPDTRKRRLPGEFTILIDPWLKGRSSVLHPTFQISHHTLEPVVSSLSDIKEHIDLIVISQDKPDHCHRETLCSLPKDRPIDILATPGAAKKINSWKYFDERRVFALNPYDRLDNRTVVRITLPAYTSGSAAGEVTIANIPTKRDVTGLHNAIGITYRPPSTHFTLNTQWDRYNQDTTVQLSANGMTGPAVAARRPQTADDDLPSGERKQLRKTQSFPYLPKEGDDKEPMKKPLDELVNQQSTEQDVEPIRLSRVPSVSRKLVKKASTRSLKATSPSRADSVVVDRSSPNQERIVSLVYTPHGISPSVLTSYVQDHLAPLKAVPLTALFHGWNMVWNPWFMGGKVAAGAPGGLELVKSLGVRHWVSAHDEKVDTSGLATTFIKRRDYLDEEVRALLKDAGQETRTVQLGPGESVNIRADGKT
jgi:hypothetical protein